MPMLPEGRRPDQMAALQHDILRMGGNRRLRDAGLLAVPEPVADLVGTVF